MRHIVLLGVIAIFVPSLSPASDQLDSSVYQRLKSWGDLVSS